MANNALTLFLASCLIGFGAVLSSRPNFDGNHFPSWDKEWCVAQVGVPAPILQGFIDYACGVTDCGPIESGGDCFKPNNVYEHASFALNQEYRRTGVCNVDTGSLTTVDPSYGHCHYP